MYKLIELIAFVVAATSVLADVSVTGATAQQRYPWNGMVDVAFTITGDSGTKYDTSFVARDVAGGTNLTMKTVYKSDGSAAALTNQLAAGSYKWVWNAAADLPDGFECERVAVDMNASEVGKYPTNGLRVYWPFNGNGNDVSGNAFNMSNSGATFVEDRFGTASKAAYFNGSSRMKLNKAIGVLNTMSFSMWVKPEKSGYIKKEISGTDLVGYNTTSYVWKDFPMIIIPAPGVANIGTTGYHLNPGELGLAIGVNRIEVFSTVYWESTFSLLKCFYSKRDLSLGDTWHHIVVVINNRSAPKVYLDGSILSGNSAAFNTKVTVGSGNTQSTIDVVSSVFVATSLDFGGRNTESYSNYSGSGDQTYKGYIDDFMIYNRVLTDAEILQLSKWK